MATYKVIQDIEAEDKLLGPSNPAAVYIRWRCHYYRIYKLAVVSG